MKIASKKLSLALSLPLFLGLGLILSLGQPKIASAKITTAGTTSSTNCVLGNPKDETGITFGSSTQTGFSISIGEECIVSTPAPGVTPVVLGESTGPVTPASLPQTGTNYNPLISLAIALGLIGVSASIAILSRKLIKA